MSDEGDFNRNFAVDYNFDFLVGYYFGAGNVIQLSYKKGSRTENFLTEKGHSITLKVSYLLRI
jgi:hypothetical protein